MKEYDVFVAGGAVAGPVTAKFCAMQNLHTLLVEREKAPREKPCSGIQFPYFEKIIGEHMPSDRLCNNMLSKVEMHLPNGKVISARFPMLNFMRDTFDEWLCRLAQSYGAEFMDSCCFKDFEETDNGTIIHLVTDEGVEAIKAKYVVDATGMRPVIRRKLRKADGFQNGSTGVALNYYFTADGTLESDRLYQFWDIEYNNMMFAWVYNKTLNDGKDYWVVGTGYDKDIYQRMDRFFDHIKELYHLKNVKIVKKEGYSSSMSFTDEERIWLGERNFLMVGDAAGLIDLTRGVGMDAAALSGRLAAKAIGLSQTNGEPVIDIYTRLMKNLVNQTRKNQQRGIFHSRQMNNFRHILIKTYSRWG
ncbi:NAD(P)/FAD-dependent oxidoreductase [Candidatus Bathyarchaeota archaeon]|nr:NAD(P)/FAD-dependent oxidoreductase [Candidatus Bathyarchaeota archaeon]